jgi:hypothetical protein
MKCVSALVSRGAFAWGELEARLDLWAQIFPENFVRVSCCLFPSHLGHYIEDEVGPGNGPVSETGTATSTSSHVIKDVGTEPSSDGSVRCRAHDGGRLPRQRRGAANHCSSHC